MRRHQQLAGLLMLAAMALPRQAAATEIGANYAFPDGTPGFNLTTSSGPEQPAGFLNPGVLVGFNPQPDPPGTPPTLLSLDDPTVASFGNSFNGPGANTYRLYLSFLGIGAAALPDINQIPPGPCRPSTDSNAGCPANFYTTAFSFGTMVGDTRHTFDVALGFLGNFDGGWSSFNPQPDPPGDGLFVDIGFAGDPQFFLSVSEDGRALSFAAVPEPGTLSLLGGALVLLLALGRRPSAHLSG